MGIKSKTDREKAAHTGEPGDLDRKQSELNLDELSGAVGGTNPSTITRVGPEHHKHIAGVKYE
jgi:hypothetical protein